MDSGDQLQPLICRLCEFPGSDVRLEACGCTIHAKCLPLNLVVSRPHGLQSHTNNLVAAKPNTQTCPGCQSALVSRIYLFPLRLDDLDKASKLKRQHASSKIPALRLSGNTNDNGKRHCPGSANSNNNEPNDSLEVPAESPYLLLLGHCNNNSASSSGMDSDYLRTGRWTEEETAYVDFLVEGFDRGQLVMPQNVRLNDMLRDLLLCKASRLTKKMKHARLSTRSYHVQVDAAAAGGGGAAATLNRVMMSTLEQKFVDSVTPEATRLELRCFISKAWRSFLSSLCLQVGSDMLDAHDWITSLDVAETRASEAEKVIRNARRRRMGIALKTDVRSAHHGVFISGMPPSKRAHTSTGIEVAPNVSTLTKIPSTVDVTADSSGQSIATTSSEGDEYISQILDFGDNINQSMTGGNGNSNNMEYLTMLFDTLVDNKKPTMAANNHASVDTNHMTRSSCGPFLDTIMSFVEANNLPFEHIDVWVPSYQNAEGQQAASGAEMRLFHAGYVTRADIDPARFVQLNEYGEYSTKFSFRPGCGLPGRVFTSGEPSWERGISDVDPKIFERAGGARVYNVNTGFGIPLSTPAISRMVIVMYCGVDIVEDLKVMEMCRSELERYDPEPKWKLVVDIPVAQTQQGAIRHRSASVGSANSSNVSKMAAITVDPLEEEQRIATLLGDHIPLTELPGQETSLHFMYLRLLLLRSRDKRSAGENEAIEMIRKSYRGYTHESKRTEKEVAFLIVRDWQFLQQGSQAIAPLQQPKQPVPTPPPHPEAQYKSHEISVPNNLRSYPSAGGPTRMPPVLSFVDPSTVGRKKSVGGMGSSSSANKLSQSPSYNVNIVDENTD